MRKRVRHACFQVDVNDTIIDDDGRAAVLLNALTDLFRQRHALAATAVGREEEKHPTYQNDHVEGKIDILAQKPIRMNHAKRRRAGRWKKGIKFLVQLYSQSYISICVAMGGCRIKLFGLLGSCRRRCAAA